MIRETVTIPIPGLDREHVFLQVADAHVAPVDETSTPEELDYAAHSTKKWTPKSGDHEGITPIECYYEMFEDVRESGCEMLLLCGDIVYRPTPLSVRFVEETLAAMPCDYWFVPGNHDIGKEKGRYPMFEKLTGPTPAFTVRDYGSFLMVSIDNSSKQVEEFQIEALKEQAKRGLPILLLIHEPLITDDAIPTMIEKWGDPRYHHFLMGGLNSDEVSCRFADYVKSEESRVLAIFAGHCHREHTGPFAPGGRMQYIAGPVFEAYSRKIILVPAD